MEALRDIERELALHYAPPDRRDALRALWAYDERLAGIVADTKEPEIGEMRLLWWREAVEKLAGRVPAEPLLERIAGALDDVRTATPWGAIAEGWHALLQMPIEAAELERHAAERGGRLFTLSAKLLGGEAEGVEAAGRGWALIDLVAHSADEALAEQAAALAKADLSIVDPRGWPRALRPLGALTVLARRDLERGPKARRQGSPARVARMAWHRISGR